MFALRSAPMKTNDAVMNNGPPSAARAAARAEISLAKPSGANHCSVAPPQPTDDNANGWTGPRTFSPLAHPRKQTLPTRPN